MTSLAMPFLVALGGGLGTLLRWAISLWVKPTALPVTTNGSNDPSPKGVARFPTPTFITNITACALLGLASRLAVANGGVYAIAAVGICGGLSTYSTLAIEVASLFRAQHRWVALWYLSSTLIGGLLVFLVSSGRLL